MRRNFRTCQPFQPMQEKHLSGARTQGAKALRESMESLFGLEPFFRARRRVDDVNFLDGLIHQEASVPLSDTPTLDAHLTDDVREKRGVVSNVLLLLRHI